MIFGWQYDDGKPTWSAAISDFVGTARRPGWHCSVGTAHAGAVVDWLVANYVEDEDFEATFRFNSGSPRMFITIYDPAAATAFNLTWIHDDKT